MTANFTRVAISAAFVVFGGAAFAASHPHHAASAAQQNGQTITQIDQNGEQTLPRETDAEKLWDNRIRESENAN